MQSYTKLQNISLIVIRIAVAAIFICAAYGKLSFWSGIPEGMTAGTVNFMKFISIAEALGALALIIGFLTRWAASGLAIIMVGAIFIMKFSMNVGFSTPTGPGWSFPFVILAGCLILLTFGVGPWSVDEKLKR